MVFGENESHAKMTELGGNGGKDSGLTVGFTMMKGEILRMIDRGHEI